jgi:insulysin
MNIFNLKSNKFFLLLFCLSSLTARTNKQTSEVVVDKNPLKILTPSLKDISTKKLILSNDIKVFLISDQKARTSSAAVAVNAGSWHDPIEYPGMAHFCEHMLFMGSKKYPDENGFWQFILDNGGLCNAYTKPDRTVYMFSIDNDQLDLSIDMFSRFFIDPVFSENSIGRELLAVNQEHNKNIENDSWRSWFIFKKEGNQNHPNAKFSTGTEETLKIIKRSELEKWYQNHYKSNGMYLVVYSNKDLDTLTSLVEKTFGKVPQATDSLNPIPYSKLTSPAQEGHITYIEPIKDIKNLSICWEIPPAYANDMDKKTYSLIAYALSHHMNGGLYANLKKEGLIENLTSECDRIGKDHLLLTINMNLTLQGIQKTDHIIYTFFQALNKLKNGNIPSHIYNDVESVLSTSYKWQSRQDSFEMTMGYADSMIDENLDTFPYKTMVITDFDSKNSRDLLNFLNPQNAIFTITGKSEDTHKTANKTEPWMGAKYCSVKVNEEILSSWESASPHKDIILPNPNPYISKHQVLLNETISSNMGTSELIAEEETGKCFFWQDNYYLIPKTQIFLRIKSPEINDSLKSLCLNKLYISYLNYHLSSLISEGSFADIQTRIYEDELGLNISVDGYHDKIGSYMMSFLSSLTSCYPTKEEFILIKDSLLSSCRSAQKSLPYNQGLNILSSIISNVNLDSKTEEKVLLSITLEDLQLFQKNILEENYLNVYISGNIDKKNALLHFSEIKNTLSSKPYLQANHYVPKYIPFYTESSFPKKITIKTDMGGNSAILLIDEGDFTFEKSASSKILSTVLKEAFFSELRSKQQTGYLVHAKALEVKDHLLQYFIVQSTTHYPEELLARYELFLEDYNRSIEEKITKERFDNVKDSLIKNYKIPTEDLHSFAQSQFELAFTYNGEFDRKDKIIKALEDLSYENFVQESKSFICRANTKRLAVLVEGSKIDNKAFSYRETSAKDLTTARK